MDVISNSARCIVERVTSVTPMASAVVVSALALHRNGRPKPSVRNQFVHDDLYQISDCDAVIVLREGFGSHSRLQFRNCKVILSTPFKSTECISDD